MTLAQELEMHYSRCWGGSPTVKHWDKGPVWELPTSFCVFEFTPSSTRRLWTYATCGLSGVLDEDPIELHLFSPVRTDQLVELLTVVAHYHRNEQPLSLNHTVNFGRSWLNNSECNYGLLSLPYLDGPAVEHFRSQNTEQMIRCLWLLPITERERDYKLRYGVDALEAKFEAGNLNYADPERESVV